MTRTVSATKEGPATPGAEDRGESRGGRRLRLRRAAHSEIGQGRFHFAARGRARGPTGRGLDARPGGA
eukprot:766977-Hanusia_phi.AAC.6